MSRIRELSQSFPLATLSVVVVCAVGQLLVFVMEPELTNYTINARSVIYNGEYYRMLTAAVLHGGLMHIVFNMMSASAIGSGLEATLGTLGMFITILWSIILCGVVYCAGEWFMTFVVTGDSAYLMQNAVGFSGVIFTMALLESFTAPPHSTRSVFGFFQVPTRLYPFVLLIALQLLMPGVSMAGHLGGIVVGLMHVYGATALLLPTPGYLKKMESWDALHGLVAKRNFVPVPPALLESRFMLAVPSSAGGGARGAIGSVAYGVRYAARATWWVISTVLHILGLRSGDSGGGGNSRSASSSSSNLNGGSRNWGTGASGSRGESPQGLPLYDVEGQPRGGG